MSTRKAPAEAEALADTPNLSPIDLRSDPLAKGEPWEGYRSETTAQIIEAVQIAADDDDLAIVQRVVCFEWAHNGRSAVIDVAADFLVAHQAVQWRSVIFRDSFGLQRFFERVDVPGSKSADIMRRRFALHVIARAAEPERNECTYLSHSYLACVLGCSDQTVRADLAKCEAAGLLLQERRGKGGNSREHNRYTLLPKLPFVASNAISDSESAISDSGSAISDSGPAISDHRNIVEHHIEHPSEHRSREPAHAHARGRSEVAEGTDGSPAAGRYAGGGVSVATGTVSQSEPQHRAPSVITDGNGHGSDNVFIRREIAKYMKHPEAGHVRS